MPSSTESPKIYVSRSLQYKLSILRATVESLPPERPIPIFLIFMLEFDTNWFICERNSLIAFFSKERKKHFLQRTSPE